MKRQPLKRTIFSLLSHAFMVFLCFCGMSFSFSGQAEAIDRPDNWALLSGYGTSHPGWGQTEERVETIDVVLRYGHILYDDIGSSWYRGNHSLLIELPVHLLFNPDSSPMVGLNFLACYTFTSDKKLQPYLFAGGGPLYTDADIPGMGSKWNGNYQFGGGVKYRINSKHDLLFEGRFHHVSNGDTKSPNDPLNSTKFLMGITF